MTELYVMPGRVRTRTVAPPWQHLGMILPSQTRRRYGRLSLQAGGVRRYSLAADFGEVPMQLKLSTRTMDGVTILDCSGRIIFGDEAAALRETVKKLLGDTKQIVLNIGQVNYIDSGGLGTLVALYTTARNSGGNVKLAKLTQRVGD